MFQPYYDAVMIETPVATAATEVTLICRIHGQRMKGVDVPIAYGQDARSAAYRRAQRDLFPNSRQTVSGGCLILETQPTTAVIAVCERCSVARRSWLSRNAAKP